jgi:hypothetical protein
MNNNLHIYDCPPSLADVVSGVIPHPQEIQLNQHLHDWFDETPVYQKMVNEIFGFNFDTDNTDIKGSTEFELLKPAHRFIMIAPNVLNLLGVNADGTHLIVLDLRAELKRLYEFESKFKQSSGRPKQEIVNSKTLSQRKWREKQKIKPSK